MKLLHFVNLDHRSRQMAFFFRAKAGQKAGFRVMLKYLKTSFYTNLIKLRNYYNIPFNFNHDNLDDTKILHFVDHMQKKYITHWKHSLCNSQKLEFCNVFKDSYTLSTYLDLTRKNPNRKTLVKLRRSDHKLNIETGRYDNISRCNRICPVCGLSVEDEIHFLFDCRKYSAIRDDFF